MRVPLYQVDAFTERPFAGNPAAVCLLDSWPDEATLQAVAAENNLSETAFVAREGDVWRLRWFTPLVEVPLCGHATLAAAHVLLGRSGEGRIVFATRSGALTVTRDGARYVLDLPANPARACDPSRELAEALGRAPEELLENGRAYLAVYGAARDVLSLVPDQRAVLALPRPYVIVTAPGDDCDFVSRFFAPGVGVPEDPVTGSAHCTLVPFWAERLGRTRLHARQVSRRGGTLWCEERGARVALAGHAVTVIEGTLHLPDPAS